MFDREVVQKRLEKLDEYVQLLEKLSAEPKDKFVSNPLVYGNVERYLHLAIQVCIDIGNHFLSNSNSKTPVHYRDIFLLLGEKRIITNDLAKKISPLDGLRNILVHDYLEIDLERIYLLLQENLSDFKEFARQVTKYMFA